MAPTFTEWAAPDLSLIGKANPFGAFEHLGFVAATLLAFVILLSIFFDAMGTMVGLATEAGTIDKDGNIPNVDRVLQVDALGAIVGGGASVSSNQIFVESGAGIGEGARTGLASIVTGLLFLVAMFFTPLINLVPFEAVAPALVVVGFMMVSQVGKIDWQDWGIAIPAFLTFTLMPFTYSIANGLGAGFIAFVLIRAVPGPRPRRAPADVGCGRGVPAVLRHRPDRGRARDPLGLPSLPRVAVRGSVFGNAAANCHLGGVAAGVSGIPDSPTAARLVFGARLG